MRADLNRRPYVPSLQDPQIILDRRTVRRAGKLRIFELRAMHIGKRSKRRAQCINTLLHPATKTIRVKTEKVQ